MIVLPTVGDARARGEITAEPSCWACGHEAIVSTDGMPDSLPFPDITLKQRCRCGSKTIIVRKDMMAHYARMHAETGWKAGP